MPLSPNDVLILVLVAAIVAMGALALIGHLGRGDAVLPDPLDYLDLTDLVDSDRLLAHRSQLADHNVMQVLTDITEAPMWRVGRSGAVDWHNRAYDTLLVAFGHDPETLPRLPNLFDGLMDEGDVGTTCRRVSLTNPQGDVLWYDLRGRRMSEGRVYVASPVTATMEAESATKGLVQTLANTFAHLRVGLALFDRNRQLMLFNPALTDLTGVPSTWLAARPRLESFFDRLRDDRVMPEPRNYTSWRTRIENMEQAARDGGYSDLWSLPDGRMYRVIGRPHPNDGLALLIEDISDEIATNRQLRGDLELASTLLDRAPDPLAILSRHGDILCANAAFHATWPGLPPDAIERARQASDGIAVELTDGSFYRLVVDAHGQDGWIIQLIPAPQIGASDLRRAS